MKPTTTDTTSSPAPFFASAALGALQVKSRIKAGRGAENSDK